MKSIFKKIAFVLALAMVVTLLPAKAVSAASSDGPDMYKTLRLYLDSGNGITENGDLTGAFTNARYASVWGWRENGFESVTFESADPGIATVSSKGLVTAVKVGSTTVTATFTGSGVDTVVKECVVTVKRNAAKVGLSADSAKQVEAGLSVGEKLQLTAVRKDAEGNTEWNKTMRDYTTDSVRFKSSNEDVFKVTKTTGMITATGAGEATLTVWAVQSEGKDAQTGEYPVGASKEYKVVVNSFSAEATGVKEITVTGAFTKDSTFEVKKGNQSINATAAVAEDGKTAVLTLTSKLTKGTYTVSCGDLKAEITAEDEYVASITVLEDGGMATVNPATSQSSNDARTKLYVHYDVLNQYGESVRKAYSVDWVSSVSANNSYDDDKNLGVLTFTSASVINYGTTVIITGVHNSAGNVKTVQATVTAGLENHVGQVEVAGIVKKGTSVFTTLPAGFADDDYYLAVRMLDRLGYEMKYSNAEAANLTFTSLSPLLIASFGERVLGGVTVDGVTYAAVPIKKGIQANRGGIAQIQITSNQTGLSTACSLEIVSEQILTTFKLLSPDVVIAQGDSDTDGYRVVIPYEAYDQNGEAITNFRVLCGNVNVNASQGNLYFQKQDDGSAVLLYNVPSSVGASKNVDIPCVFTSTVVMSGSVSNVTVNIKDTAVPTTIKGFGSDVKTKLVEGDSATVGATGNGGLVYYDQYDREMSNDKAAARFTSGQLKVGVKLFSDQLQTSGRIDQVDEYEVFNDTNKMTFAATGTDVTSLFPVTLQFVIIDKNNKVQSASDENLTMTVVDIKQCNGFELSYDNKTATDDWTISSESNSKLFYDETGENSYNANFSVTGKLADGSTVDIPNQYLTYSAKGIGTIIGVSSATVSGSAVKADFEDKSGLLNEDGTKKYRELDFEVNVVIADQNGIQRTTLTKKIVVGVNNIKYTTITPKGWMVNDGKATISATNGAITYDKLMTYIMNYIDNYGKVYGTNWSTWRPGMTITVSNLTENISGLYSDDSQYGTAASVNGPLTFIPTTFVWKMRIQMLT